MLTVSYSFHTPVVGKDRNDSNKSRRPRLLHYNPRSHARCPRAADFQQNHTFLGKQATRRGTNGTERLCRWSPKGHKAMHSAGWTRSNIWFLIFFRL